MPLFDRPAASGWPSISASRFRLFAGLFLMSALVISGCSTTDGQSSEDTSARSAGVDAASETPTVTQGERSGEASVAIDAKTARKLKRMRSSRKDPFALSRSMRMLKEQERLAAEKLATEKAAAAKVAAKKAAKKTQAARKAAIKAKREAAKTRVRGGLVIGDSVALGAEQCLGSRGFEVDAVQSRSFNAGFAALKGMPRSALPKNIVVHLGTNGPFSTDDFRAVMSHIGSAHHVTWVTIALPDRDIYSFESSLNHMIKNLADEYPNTAVADWNAVSNGKSQWFYDDQIHINLGGCQGFADVVDAAAGS